MTTFVYVYLAASVLLFAALTVLGAAHQRQKQIQRDREEGAGVSIHNGGIN